jgi:hypothetical protein
MEKPVKHYRYQWVWGDDSRRYYDVWIEPDGSLHNPNNYPEDLARAAALAADERKAKRVRAGVELRRQRREARIYEAARRILKKEGIGNRKWCFCCHKALSDPESIGRAVGSECWQHVLDRVAQLTVEEGKAERRTYAHKS